MTRTSHVVHRMKVTAHHLLRAWKDDQMARSDALIDLPESAIISALIDIRHICVLRNFNYHELDRLAEKDVAESRRVMDEEASKYK